MTSSRDVLRLHADLAERLENPYDAVGNMVKKYATHAFGDHPSANYRKIALLFHQHLRSGRSYHVAPDMVDLTMRRAVDDTRRPGTTPISACPPPPFAMGFCVFGTPLEIVEAQGRTERAVALTWGPAETQDPDNPSRSVSGRLMGYWSHHTLAPDDMTKVFQNDEGLRLTGGWSLMHIDFTTHDMKLGPVWLPTKLESRQQAAMKGYAPVEHTLSTGWITTSLWELMGETLSVVHGEERPDKRQVRMARRAKIGTQVTTITLRREARPTLHPGSGTPLAWRTPVNGHYRTYHRGTANEFTIWIKDHERGPREAPYRETEKVYNLKR